jgi:hypothetical protein
MGSKPEHIAYSKVRVTETHGYDVFDRESCDFKLEG